MKTTLLFATIAMLLSTACSQDLNDWPTEAENTAHREAFENYRPDPASDSPILIYTVTKTTADALSLDITVPNDVTISPSFLSVYTEQTPAQAAIEFTTKNYLDASVSSTDRISVKAISTMTDKKYAVTIQMPKGISGKYIFKVRLYTHYTYGHNYVYTNKYAYSTELIEFTL